MRLTVCYQTVDLDKVGSLGHLRYVSISLRYVRSAIHVSKDIVATLVSVSDIKTQRVSRHIARMNERRSDSQCRGCRRGNSHILSAVFTVFEIHLEVMVRSEVEVQLDVIAERTCTGVRRDRLENGRTFFDFDVLAQSVGVVNRQGHVILCIAASVSRCIGLCYRVDDRQMRYAGQRFGSRAVMETTCRLNCDRTCYSIRRQCRKRSCSGLLDRAVGHKSRRDTRSRCTIYVHRQRSVLVNIIEGDGEVIRGHVTSSNRCDSISHVVDLRLGRRSERRLVVVGTTFCSFEIDFVLMRSRSLPSIRERIFLFGIGSSCSNHLLVGVPILKDNIVSLAVGKLRLHGDAKGRIAASVRLYGCRSSSNLRPVRSGYWTEGIFAVQCLIVGIDA